MDSRRMGGSLLLLLALFTIGDCQNVPVITTSLVNLREDLRIGERAFQIEAYDPDGDTLTYKIENDKGHFEVNLNTGEVSIKNPLDREVEEVLVVKVTADDGNLAATEKDVTIVVGDANDNAPIFQNTPYNKALPENTPVGSTVLTVTATDADIGLAGIVTYRIQDVMPSEGNSMFSITDRGGAIMLNEPLSFTNKSAFYQIRINASDGGGPLLDDPNRVQSAVATAFLTVTDMPNLDPQFLNLPSSTPLKENSPVGTSVYKVVARDPDTGINDIIHYSIAVSNPDLFQINEKDGTVTVKSEIDREALLDIDAVVKLTVKATEDNLNVNGIHAFTEQTLDIVITDENDNKPMFYKCDGDACNEENTFSCDIDEHSSVGLAVTGLNMVVKDADQEGNFETARFLLSLEGPDKDAFSVSPKSGISNSDVQILMNNPNAVDYEKQTTMTVQVIAMDAIKADFVSTATVTIQINDINDNRPEFESIDYKLNVSEHCLDGTIVDTITATDKDALDNGNIAYKLLPDSIRTLFDVHPNNGTVYVKSGKDLDREKTNSYSPTLQATDSAGNIGSTILEITVRDINDQTPQFLRSYEFFPRENTEVDFTVEARDNDEPGTPNSKIQYAIVGGAYSTNFTVDPNTGMVKSQGTLDREAIDINLNGRIELNISATDMGTPPLSTWTVAIVNVDDVNDNPPVVEKEQYSFSVKESEAGISVGKVLARDADQTEYNNRISFRITSGSFGNFLCLSEKTDDGYSGDVMVDPDVELNYESDYKEYTLTVEATDLAQNKAEVTVFVKVEDVNDTPPEFPLNLIMAVEENSPAKEIEQIIGSDVDTNHSLTYELVSLDCYCNSTWALCEEDWFILEPSGMVKTSPDYTIDYEKCTEVKMKARVVDLYTEKNRNSTEGEVSIKVLDVNDNAPEFIKIQEFFVVISENVEKDSSVAIVYASDKDTGENKRITYEVVKVELLRLGSSQPESLEKIFYVDENVEVDKLENYKGVMKSIKSLDSEIKGKYLVTVAAKSGNWSTNDVIELVTVDKSYNIGLRFNAPVEDVNYNLPLIRGALTGATKAMVHIVKVSTETQKMQRNTVTVVEVYFVYPNGTALDSDALARILNSQGVYEEYGILLQQYGLTGILSSGEPTNDINTEFFIMVGVSVGLAIVLVVMIISLMCIRTSYKRKLRAANAMNTASMMDVEDQKGGPVVPGTNKYTRDGANPVLNLNIDTATDLGFDEDDSNADRESLNSLDYNFDIHEKDTVPMMPIDEEDEDESPYIEPLDAALAQRGRKSAPEPPSFTIANSSLSTTDL